MMSRWQRAVGVRYITVWRSVTWTVEHSCVSKIGLNSNVNVLRTLYYTSGHYDISEHMLDTFRTLT